MEIQPNNQPDIQQPVLPSSPKRIHKGLLAIIILALIAGIVSYFTLLKNKTNSEPHNTTQSNSTLKTEMVKEVERCYSLNAMDVKNKSDITLASVVIPEYEDVIILQNDCLQKLAINERDATICDKYLTDSSKNPTARRNCNYIVSALAKGDSNSCKNIPFVEQQEVCLIELAKSKKDINICNLISPASKFISACYTEIASAKQDGSLCNKLSNQEDKANCIEGIAKASLEPDLCYNITSGWSRARQEDCLATIAAQTKNFELCKKISEYEHQNECVLRVAKNSATPFACDSLTNAARDYCYYGVAVALKNVEFCKKIKQGNQIDCYSDLALITDPSPCNSITDETRKSYCMYRSIIVTKKAEACNSITNIDSQQKCYKEVAPIVKEVKWCDKVTDNWERKGCYDSVAVASKDISICDNIKIPGIVEEDQKGECYMGIAHVAEDAATCERLGKLASTLKDLCYYSLATKKADKDVCEKMGEARTRNMCLFEVAQTTQNTSVCNAMSKSGVGGDQTYSQGNCYTCIARSQANVEICKVIPDAYDRNDCYYNLAAIRNNASICESITNESSKQECQVNVKNGGDFLIGSCSQSSGFF
jgi:hypothetical protein